MSAKAVLTLGRDGVGDDEGGFEGWVSWVTSDIDERVGFEVEVDSRAPRDVQSDAIAVLSGDREVVEQTIRDALTRLWDEWCQGDAP